LTLNDIVTLKSTLYLKKCANFGKL